MSELNNNQTEFERTMEYTHNNMPTRRRRLCSVVAPKLGVEYTKEGRKTVVVGNAAPNTPTMSPKMRMHHAGTPTQEPSLPISGVMRHNSLPRRIRLESASDLRNSTLRAAHSQRLNSCDDRHFQHEYVSTEFMAARSQCCISENSRVPCAKPELAINLSCRHHEMNAQVTRKTQRSMSAHSVATPGPDSTVLRDPITNKMYKRGKLLGKGGFARVYEGIDLSTSKRYALKIIDKSRLARPPQREKVDAEIELHAAASDVGHPNVARFETSFENARVICIVLELCGKRSLAQHLRRKEFLSESEVSDITWQIVCGLAHIHGCGLLHRDLKLGNILLADDMTVKVGDFGLATRASWGKRRTICGTPNFIAPEVLQRQGHGPEADIWALGCILFTLLVGKPPFETTSLKDTYKCILKNSYRIPATISPEAADLVRWMLRSKPHARPTLQDISNHVFFLKHQTQLRYPSIDQLAKEFPSKEISSESALPLRRQSVLPRITVDSQSSSSRSYTTSPGPARHNSCPSDPCSIYSTKSNAVVRNDPASSAGPKISILDHMKQVNENSELSIEKTCTENTPSQSPVIESPEAEDDINTSEQSSNDNNNQPECVVNKVSEENTKNNVKSAKFEKMTKKQKPSPVKMLASKLQKFKIPSPKSCMKAAMKSKTSDYKTNASPIIPTKPEIVENFSQSTWITKWVDYSNKYGFGYQLSDGSICVLFNDGSHIALLADGKTVQYTEPDWEATSSTCTFSLQNPPQDLIRPVSILQHFTAYMDKNLMQGSGKCETTSCASVRMLTWSRTTKHVAMYLSNGTLQINFSDDHTKLNVSNIHRRSAMTVSYVNEKKETSVYESSQIASIKDSGLRRRLQQAHEEFHVFLGEDSCISHPFCTAIGKNSNHSEPALKQRDAFIAVA